MVHVPNDDLQVVIPSGWTPSSACVPGTCWSPPAVPGWSPAPAPSPRTANKLRDARDLTVTHYSSITFELPWGLTIDSYSKIFAAVAGRQHDTRM